MDTLVVDVRVPRAAFTVDVTLEAPPGTLALLGPSGAGKSTVLRAAAGLERPSGGRVLLGQDVWSDHATGQWRQPEQRSVGVVFQNYALFPHMTARQNVAFARGDDPDEVLEWLGIGHLATRRPAQLSGGERQRVALARALSRRPRVLLLDEPLAALDPHTRGEVRALLARLLDELRLPTVIVTHDVADVAALADTVVVVEDGRVTQRGTLGELARHPATPFVAAATAAASTPILGDTPQ